MSLPKTPSRATQTSTGHATEAFQGDGLHGSSPALRLHMDSFLTYDSRICLIRLCLHHSRAYLCHCLTAAVMLIVCL